MKSGTDAEPKRAGGSDLAARAADYLGATERMFAAESKDIVSRAGQRVGLCVAGLLLAAAGMVVAGAALGMLLGQALGSPILGWALSGVVLLAVGGAAAVSAARALAKDDPFFPVSRREIVRDLRAFGKGVVR